MLKNETLDNAFTRLTEAEVGTALIRSDSSFLGVYEHFYENSVFEDCSDQPSTHYVVLAHHLRLSDSNVLNPPIAQHEAFAWWNIDEMKDSPLVHQYTRAYLAALIK